MSTLTTTYRCKHCGYEYVAIRSITDASHPCPKKSKRQVYLSLVEEQEQD